MKLTSKPQYNRIYSQSLYLRVSSRKNKRNKFCNNKFNIFIYSIIIFFTSQICLVSSAIHCILFNGERQTKHIVYSLEISMRIFYGIYPMPNFFYLLIHPLNSKFYTSQESVFCIYQPDIISPLYFSLVHGAGNFPKILTYQKMYA